MPARIFVVAITAAVVCACTGKTGDVPSEQRQLEAALIPVVTFAGEEDTRPSFGERQAELGVPLTSVAVAKGWELQWAKAYGGNGDEYTRFQAASLSKTVAAAGLLTLAEDLHVGLDDDLSKDLAPVSLPQLNPRGLPITLRGLLSHTNGTSISGFPGYPAEAPIPTSFQIVAGTTPANTDPVVVDANPAGKRKYSGGGYQVAQLWAETVTGEPFDRLMRRLVLEPVGMSHSTFAVRDVAPDESQNIARAHDFDGSEIAGGWHIYPEQAAAGLWTTPSDYARFVLALMAASEGRSERGVRESVASAMLNPVADEYGLGIGIQTRQDEIRLTHSGLNRGYICNFMAFPARGDVIVTMTNSAKGFPMVGDVNRTANVVYGWPSSPLIVKNRAPVTTKELDRFAGSYAVQGTTDAVFELNSGGDKLTGTTPAGYVFDLVKIGEDEYIDPRDGEIATFSESENGGQVVSSGGTLYVRISPPDHTT